MAFDNIKLEKGLYGTGKSFTQALEELDPSENYIGTPLEGLDAYERQLKRFNIKVSGPDSDTVAKFYSTTSTAALFPEYLSRAVTTGMFGNKVEDIIATTTQIDALDYRSIKLSNKQEDFALVQTNEGIALPELEIGVSSTLTNLKKYGRLISASYEALKFQKLDLLTLVLKHIGEGITDSEFKTAVNTITADSSVNKITSAGNELTYENLVNAWISLQPYKFTTLVVSKKTAAELLKMPEFRDANAGLDFHGTGNLITPFGANVICYDSIKANTMIALDKDAVLEKVTSGGVVTEYDKIIDRQLERAAISTITGFSVLYGGAATVLSWTGA